MDPGGRPTGPGGRDRSKHGPKAETTSFSQVHVFPSSSVPRENASARVPDSLQSPPSPASSSDPQKSNAEPFVNAKLGPVESSETRPLDEAMSSAMKQTNTRSNDFTPAQIAQITASVIEQMQQMLAIGNADAIDSRPSIPVDPLRDPYPLLRKSSPFPHDSASADSRSEPAFSTSGLSDASRSKREEDSPPPVSPARPRQNSAIPSSPSTVSAHPSRPALATRMPTAGEETPLDRTWGQLFDEEGQPTPRLSQFLRGIANHLIDDYEPQHSIVVTPRKMARFYEETALTKEWRMWNDIFRRKTNASLSRLYQDLGCQHHLIQTHNDEVPSVPSLTTLGFARWMTIQILANPGDEFERVLKTVEHMPISNADKPQERFPKMISRKLLPRGGDSKYRKLFERALRDEDVSISPSGRSGSSPSRTRREPLSQSSSSLVGTAPPKRRDDNTWDHVSDAGSSDVPGHRPIERERKPYSATPGAGRVMEDEKKAEHLSSGGPMPRTARSGSTTSRPPPFPGMFGETAYVGGQVPPAYHQHGRTQSNAADFVSSQAFDRPAPRAGSVKNRRRSRSESRDGDYRRNEGDGSGSWQDYSSDDSRGTRQSSRRHRAPDAYRRPYYRDRYEAKSGEQARSRHHDLAGRIRDEDDHYRRQPGSQQYGG